jgi:hypothetical protein
MRLKWIAGAFAALVIILFVVVYVILSGYDFNKFKPRIATAVLQATGRELTLGGDIDLGIGLTPVLTITDVSFANAPWGSRPVLARLKRLEIQVALLPLLGGNIKVKRLILVEPDILIETDRRGRSNLEFDTGRKRKKLSPRETPDKEVKLPELEFNRLLIENGNFTYRDGMTGKSYTVKIKKFASNTKSLRANSRMELRGEYNGEAFEVDGTFGSLTSMADPKKDWPIELTASAMGVTFDIAGVVRDPVRQRGIKVDFTAEADDFAKIEELAGRALPIKGPLKISGTLFDTAPKTFKVSKMNITLGESDIAGSVKLRLGDKRLGLNAALKANRLDLRPILADGDGGQGDATEAELPEGKKKDKIFSTEPLPLDALRQVNGTVEIKVSKLLLPRLAVDDLNLYLNLNKGYLTVKLLKASIGGGSVKGRVDLRPRGKRANISVSLKMKKADLALMLKDLGATDILKGKLDASVDVKSSGASQAEVMGNLVGNLTLVMGKGQVSSKYVDLLGGDLSQGVFRLINPLAATEGSTEVNCLVSRFDIKDGLAESTALVFDSTRMSVVGKGSVNLKTEKLNFKLTPSPKKGLGAEGVGKVSLSLGELAKSLKLGGTLARPSLGVDPFQAAATVGKMAKGVALFGPFGILAGLVGTNSGDENPCLAAIETAKTGVKAPEKKGVAGTAAEGITEGVKGLGEGLEEGLKMLFGK